jgi:hypothetical protein
MVDGNYHKDIKINLYTIIYYCTQSFTIDEVDKLL